MRRNFRSLKPLSRTPASPRTSRTSQRGSVLAAILLVTIVLLLIVSTLVNTYYATESSAIDRHLVETQVLWAQLGALDVLRARIKSTAPLDGTNSADADKELLVINGATPAFYPTGLTFSYPGYDLTVVATPPAPQPLIAEHVPGNAADGHFRLRIPTTATQTGATLPPMLADFASWSKRLVVDLCIGDTPSAAFPAPCEQPGDPTPPPLPVLSLEIHAIHRT